MSITLKPSALLPSFITAVGVTRLKRTVQLGMKSLWMHRLRSLLTGLGIVFGVCSVIAMLAIGEGLSYEAQEQIRRLGSNNIIIRSVKPPDDRSTSAQRTWMVEYGLTYDDISHIRNTIPGVQIIVPSRIIRKDVWNLANRIDCDIVGTVSWYPDMRNHHPSKGRFFTEEEVNANENVCVLGNGMADILFPLDEPIGNSVRVDGDYYKVIGIMEPLSRQSTGNGNNGGNQTAQTGGPSGAGAPYQMYIPLTAAKTRFGETLVQRGSGSFSAERVELHEATIKVENTEDVIETWHIISDLLSANHKKTDYEIVVPLDLLRQAERTKRIFNIVLGAIAGISLLVGGIGIMNIMLATVTERTREIGIRRALGAKKRDIVLQFVIETVLLSATGGIIGVVLGLAIPIVITYFADLKTIVTLWSPLLAFSISAFVGVVFGIYPAMRAANMDPVEALRHE
ncbi:MAG: ABC transporter permease [Candidatus Hydrogenedentes bacterium]|nr:ABC transporter permease [Candidatus Hydrogenedentota bacterium]